MSFETARILITNALAAIPLGFPVEWEASRATSPAAVWGRWSIAPGGTLPAAIGNRHVRGVGTVYLQVFMREETGVRASSLAADLVAASLDRVQLRLGVTVVTFATVSATPAGVRDGYSQVNISIDFTRDSYQAVTYGENVLADAPVSFYRLGQVAGSTMTDASGNALDGVFINAPTSGVTGRITGRTATGFAAASKQYGAVAYTVPHAFPGAFSVECWVKFNTYANTRGILARWGATNADRAWCLVINSSGHPYFFVTADGTTLKQAYQLGALGTGWVHLAATYEPGKALRLYKNGVLVNTATAAIPAALQATTSAFWVGAQTDPAVAANCLDGTLSDVALYPYVLTAGQIARHFAAAV